MHQRNGYLGAAEKARRAGDTAKAAEWEAKAAELERQYYEARAALSGTSLSSGPTTSAAGSVPGIGSAGDTGATLGSTLPTSSAGTPPAGTPPVGSGTPPVGTPPVGSGTPPVGSAPTGTPPVGSAPTGTPPAGTPPAGTESPSILRRIMNHEGNLFKTIASKDSTWLARGKAGAELGTQIGGAYMAGSTIKSITDRASK